MAPYWFVSIVSVIEPVVAESVMAAHVVMVVPEALVIAKLLEPPSSVRGEASTSTASVGMTNSDVAVLPSVTEREVGLKVIALMVVAEHGLLTVRE